MKIHFYSNSAPPNKIDKSDTLTPMVNLQGVRPKDEEDSILNITLKVRWNKYVYQSNYMYVEETGRYYFIDDIILTEGNRLTIRGTVDVLYTFKDSILNNGAWIERSSPEPNSEQWFLEQNLPLEQNKDTYSIPFPNDLFTWSIADKNILVLFSY